MVSALGGPANFVERADSYLPRAPVQREVLAEAAGFIGAMDVRGLGNAVVELGGGRKVPGQALDLAVGLSSVVDLGRRVERGEPLAVVHARSESDADEAAARVRAALSISDSAPAGLPLYRWYEPEGLPA
jgi:thymidine phosphorylase